MIEQKYYEEFADKQLVGGLISELIKVTTELKKVMITQNNLIDKIKLFEEQTLHNFIFLKKENGKLLKQIKVNKVNHFLSEDRIVKLNYEIKKSNLRLDLIDKFIDNFLIKKINKNKWYLEVEADLIKYEKELKPFIKRLREIAEKH